MTGASSIIEGMAPTSESYNSETASGENNISYHIIYSPNAIKTKHNKITQLGMTNQAENLHL